MDDSGYSGRLRKRKRPLGDGGQESLRALLDLTERCGKIVIFSGSGLSANSGMSMFTTKNGLYERARSKFKIQDGMKLFSYPFYKQRRKDLQAFFAQIYSEAQSSKAAPGHVAIAELHRMGRLQRHYTLNIDGLAAAVGMDTWHHEHNPEGSTVEMHGNISYVVCPSCHAVEPLTGNVMQTMKASQAVQCKACTEDEMRFKVMLYDDEQGDCITPEDVFERLDDDLAVAGAVIWVGISFEQSASTEYFRKVRHMLSSHGRLHEVTQVILNPSEEPYFNVISTMSNREDVKVLDVRATSDDALPLIVDHLHHLGGTSPTSAAIKAAAEAAKAAAAAQLVREQQLAAAALEQQQQQQQSTPTKGSGGRRKRHSGSSAVVGSPADHLGATATSAPSYAELAAMDSAAAAALSLPAAVQKHFAQRQLQQQLSSAAGVKQEDGSGSPAGSLQNGGHAAAAAAMMAAAVKQDGAQTTAVSSQPNAAAPLAPGLLQQPGGFQQLLGQLQAVQALQAALAGSPGAGSPAQQQQQQMAPRPGYAQFQTQAGSPLLAAAAGLGHTFANGSSHQQAGLDSSQLQLAAALASQQAGPAAAAAAGQAHVAASGSPLVAVLQQLASSPAASSLLLSNPSLLAAVTAAGQAVGGLCNGAAPAAAGTAAMPASPAAAAGLAPTYAAASKAPAATDGHADIDVRGDTDTLRHQQPATQQNGVRAAASNGVSSEEPPAASDAVLGAAADKSSGLGAAAGAGASPGCNGVEVLADTADDASDADPDMQVDAAPIMEQGTS